MYSSKTIRNIITTILLGKYACINRKKNNFFVKRYPSCTQSRTVIEFGLKNLNAFFH